MKPRISALFFLSLLLSLGSPATADERELSAYHRKWLEEEVVYIITPQEKEAFLRLDSDELRDGFIQVFWEKRDPTPGTARNEFREEHYKRIEFANKNFGPRGQKNGWRSERGRMYILLGKPKERLEFPSDALVYPLELWFYSSDKRIDTASFFYLIFFKRGGAGDYQLYHPVMDGPGALTWKGNFDFSSEEVMRALELLHYEVANAAISLNPLDPGNSMSSEVLLAEIDSYPERMVDGGWATTFVETRGKAEVKYDFQPLEPDFLDLVFSPLDGRQQLHYGFMLRPEDIQVGFYEDNYYSAYEIISGLADKDGNLIFEKSSSIELNWTIEEFVQSRSKPVFFTDVVPIVPGDFTFTIRVINKVSNKYFLIVRSVSAPQPKADTFFLSNPLLAFKYERSAASDGIAAPFRFFDVQYSPSPTNEVAGFENVHVFCQLTYPPLSNGSPQVGQISYEFDIFRDEQLVKKMTHIIGRERVNPSGLSYISRQLPVSELDPGDYRLVIRASEDLGGMSATRSLVFSIKAPEAIARPVSLPLDSTLSINDPETGLARARQLMATGQFEAAEGELKGLLAADRTRLEAAILLSKTLNDMGRCEEAYQAVVGAQQEDPNNRDLVLALARSCRRCEEPEKAAGFYERLLFVDGEDCEVLNEVAEVYEEMGRLELAEERRRRSLEVNPDQPEIREKLERR